MKSTGIVRNTDELGRIVLPKELRDILGIRTKERLEIYIEGSKIIIERCEKGCSVCNSNVDLKKFKNKLVCSNCINVISDMI